MTQILITIDTELSFAFEQAGRSADDNFASSILGRCAAGEVGIGWQMDRLEAHGLTGVFFVDPMPALAHGIEPIARIVEPIVARGHEAQLHIHTEWLAVAKDDPVGGRRGQNIADFSLDDQRTLLGLARTLLVEAGAPPPIAFRAGNYGANDDTLTVLAELGLRYDSSFNPAYLGAPCAIGLPAEQVATVARNGVTEVPVAAIEALPGRLRHAQICALSAGEMRAMLGHAAASGQPQLAIVTHSFEMLSRDRLRPNRAVIARFEALTQAVAADTRLESAGFENLLCPSPSGEGLGWGLSTLPELSVRPRVPTPNPASGRSGPRPDLNRPGVGLPDVPGGEGLSKRLPPSYPRTLSRIAQQAVARLRYERG